VDALTRPIVLLTDFGLHDHYVGQMKCVLASIAPRAQLIDLSHEVEPYAVDEGAWMLETTLPVLPEDAVVLAVVDPGVGTSRRPLAVQSGRRTWIGPDNGLLSPAFPVELRRGLPGPTRVTITNHTGFDVHEIRETSYLRAARSHTFHGRDIFAPAAAHIANGLDYHNLGPAVSEVVLLPECCAAPERFGEIRGYVVHIDRYGNLLTTIRANQLFPSFELQVNGATIDRHVRTFADAPPGQPFCHVDSSGYIAIAMKEASVADHLGVSRGAEVRVRAR